jgi:hypothetical protein
MTFEEREKMNRLCGRIQRENDPKVFVKLVLELNEFLDSVKNGLRGAAQDKS